VFQRIRVPRNAVGLDGASALHESEDHHHQRDNQKKMNQAAHRIGSYHPQGPQHQQNDKYGPQHSISP
jgi:hypothetical protein